MAEQLYDGNGRLKYEAARALIMRGEAVSIPGRGVVSDITKLPPPEEFERGNARALAATHEANQREIERLMQRNRNIERMAAGQEGDLRDSINADKRRAVMTANIGQQTGQKLTEEDGAGYVALPPLQQVVSQTAVPPGTVDQPGVDRLGLRTEEAPPHMARTSTGATLGSTGADNSALELSDRSGIVIGGAVGEQPGAGGTSGEGMRSLLNEDDVLNDDSELPDDFPARQFLVDGGVEKIGDVRYATDARLDALDGIAEGRIRQIDEYLDRIGLPRVKEQATDQPD